MARAPKLPVLVVDDDPSALKFVSTLLKKEGITTAESDNGYAAFTYLNKQLETSGEIGVAGVISDWKMPGWDGLKLLAELRGHPVLNAIPFILVSGAVTRPELENAARQGANGLLLKPFDHEKLLTKVKELFFKP
ncbi:MAG: response regulator [Bdellovibrionales bacterium]|nr:response regulator [Bdellovibrionales bacterium]